MILLVTGPNNPRCVRVTAEQTAHVTVSVTFAVTQLCLPKMLSGANAFEIGDLQEEENGSIG